jgi:hypothetical protein
MFCKSHTGQASNDEFRQKNQSAVDIVTERSSGGQFITNASCAPAIFNYMAKRHDAEREAGNKKNERMSCPN